MSDVSSWFIPEGWHTVTPRIVVRNVEQMVAFIKRVFGATGEYRTDSPSIIQIGDSVLMESEAGIRKPTPSFLYVYVDDTDATFRPALEAGALSLEEPSDMPYGSPRYGRRSMG